MAFIMLKYVQQILCIYIHIKYLFDVLGMIEDLEAALLAFPQSSHIISLASKSG